MPFSFAHTHAFPGCRMTWRDEGEDDAVFAEFSDGSVAAAQYEFEADNLLLSVAAYKTARGTVIPAKRWRLAPLDRNGSWKVVARLAPAS